MVDEYRASTDALREWVADRTGLTTIWAHTDAPRPSRPYATVQVLNSSRVHLPAVGPPADDADGTAEVLSLRDVTVSVQIYERADEPDPRAALERAEKLRDSLDLPGQLEKLRADGWAFRDVELLTDNPVERDDHWEPRATFDARFGTTVRQLDELGIIEIVEIEGTAQMPGDTDDRTREFTVSSED